MPEARGGGGGMKVKPVAIGRTGGAIRQQGGRTFTELPSSEEGPTYRGPTDSSGVTPTSPVGATQCTAPTLTCAAVGGGGQGAQPMLRGHRSQAPVCAHPRTSRSRTCATAHSKCGSARELTTGSTELAASVSAIITSANTPTHRTYLRTRAQASP